MADRLWGHEASLQEAEEAEAFLGSFTQHAQAAELRRRLAHAFGRLRRRDRQARLLKECCDFTANAYPAATATRAWALADHADALVRAAEVDLRGDGCSSDDGPHEATERGAPAPAPPPAAAEGGRAARKLQDAAEGYGEAVCILSRMFGEEHAWAAEAAAKLLCCRELLARAPGG